MDLFETNTGNLWPNDMDQIENSLLDVQCSMLALTAIWWLMGTLQEHRESRCSYVKTRIYNT